MSRQIDGEQALDSGHRGARARELLQSREFRQTGAVKLIRRSMTAVALMPLTGRIAAIYRADAPSIRCGGRSARGT